MHGKKWLLEVQQISLKKEYKNSTTMKNGENYVEFENKQLLNSFCYFSHLEIAHNQK